MYTPTTYISTSFYSPSYSSYSTPILGYNGYNYSSVYVSNGNGLSSGAMYGLIAFVVVMCLCICIAGGSKSRGGETVVVTETFNDNIDAMIAAAKIAPISAHCKSGHGMKWCNFNPYRSEGIMCDNCNLALNDNQNFHHCFTCESDFCQSCGPQQNVQINAQQAQQQPVYQ